MDIRKSDTVLVRSGKDKGKRGKVLRVLPRADKVIVENVNLATAHRRPKKAGEKGQKVSYPAPLYRAKLSLVCPSCGKPTRLGHREEGNARVRVCKKCKRAIT